jgi:hypothetical protein
MQFNKNTFTNQSSELVMSSVMLVIQFCGLIWLKWSGLYVIYLCWIDLLFLTVYTVLRERQYRKIQAWANFKNNRPHLFEADQNMFYFFRILSLSFYLFLIAASAIPYESGFIMDENHHMTHMDYYQHHSAKDFLTGLLITDPLFLVSVFFIVSFYLKKLAAKPSTREEEMIEFSFHFFSYDPYYIYPFLAVVTFFIPIIIVYDFFVEPTQLKSYLYTYAIWLLFLRFITDLIMVYRLKKEIKRNLT